MKRCSELFCIKSVFEHGRTDVGVLKYGSSRRWGQCSNRVVSRCGYRLVGTLGTWNIFAVRGMNLNMDWGKENTGSNSTTLFRLIWYFINADFLNRFVPTSDNGCHLHKRLRKTSKVDIPCLILKKLFWVWYQLKWFSKLYNPGFSDSSSIHGVQKS